MNSKDKAERLRCISTDLKEYGDIETANFLLSLADEMEKEPKPLELSDEEIEKVEEHPEAMTTQRSAEDWKRLHDRLYEIHKDVLAKNQELLGALRSVELESFGVALLEYVTTINLGDPTDISMVREFLQSPEFEKWELNTKTGD